MNPERILLPLEIRECPLEIFPLVEGFARQPQGTLILLHVIHPNMVGPDNRVDNELALEARWYLERLTRQYVHPMTSTLHHVRVGKPAEEILEEAKAEDVQLIILPAYAPSIWNRLVSLWKPRVRPMVSPLAERIIRDSTCGVFVAGVKTRFNCEKEWGRATRKKKGPPVDCSRGSPEGSSLKEENRRLASCRPNGCV